MVHSNSPLGECWVAYGNSYAFLFFTEETIISTKELQINDEIRIPTVRLVGPEGEQLGIMKIEDARTYA